MKHLIAFAAVISLGLGAVVLGEKRRAEAPVGPGAVLYFIADAERELTRLPVAFHPLPDDEEVAIGDALARQYLGREGEAKPSRQAQAIESYVQQVGARLAANAHRKLPYRFHYVPSSYFINAFALPGGHVFIGGGMIELMDSEDEMAAVLAHEIEHIDHYHCAERVQTEAALRKLPLGPLIEIPVQVFQAGYSKDHELEADREGTRLAVAASYSPLGAIRMFETFDRLYREQVTPPETPQEELSRVAIETLQGYFRSHPLPSERIDQIRRMIVAENWGNLNRDRSLPVAYFFWTDRAKRAPEAQHYEKASQLARHSLELQPEQPEALEVLGRAQFMLADFEGAAASYRKLLNANTSNTDLAAWYAQSLGATGQYQKAAQQFRSWLAGAKLPDRGLLTRMQVSLAGLELLAGNEAPALALAKQLQQLESATDWAPEAEGQLGSWYYWAGRYALAAQLLSRALAQRPQNNDFQTRLAWALVELRNYESAIGRFEYSARWPTSRMGLAVARWRARQTDRALAEYAAAIDTEAFWRNARWVNALYPPTVTASLAEMQAEHERRLAEERERAAARRRAGS